MTRLLQRASVGNADAAAQLMPLVYGELRRVAARRMRGERHQSLEATGLVHEAYLRLAPGMARHRPQNRAHFFAMAGRAMREILVDRARERAAVKRGRGGMRVTLVDDIAETASPSIDVLIIDQAVTRLALVEPRQARVVELRYFGGLALEEIAEALDVAVPTVKRDWVKARAWLERELGRGTP